MDLTVPLRPNHHRHQRGPVPALVSALALLCAPLPVAAQAPAGAPGEPAAPAGAPGEPAPVAFTPPVAIPPTAAATGPIIHFVVKRPDPNKGFVKLARYRGATRAVVPAGNTVLVNPYFDELCTEPCGVAIDVSERPLFFFIRDGFPISHGFRLHTQVGQVTLKVKPMHRGLALAGSATLLFLVGIPLLIAAASRVWAAPGRPGPGLAFKRLKRARL